MVGRVAHAKSSDPATSQNLKRALARWWSIPRDQRLCPLCLGNLIGDEKHYTFHCTTDKLVDTRKDFVKELHESNLQSCFNDAAFSELTSMILNKGTCRMKLDKLVNSYQQFQREQMHNNERPNESYGLLFYSFRSGVV